MDSAPESISDTKHWLNWNGNLDNPHDTEDDWVAHVESDIMQGNDIEDPECPEQQDVSAAPNVPGLIQPTWKSKRQAARVFVTVNAIETRRNMGVKQNDDRMRRVSVRDILWANGEQLLVNTG